MEKTIYNWMSLLCALPTSLVSEYACMGRTATGVDYEFIPRPAICF